MPAPRPLLPMLLRLSVCPVPERMPTAPLACAVYSFRSSADNTRYVGLLLSAVTLNICDRPIVCDDVPTNAVLIVLIDKVHLGCERIGTPPCRPVRVGLAAF